MAFTGTLYGNFFLHLARKRIDLLSDTIKGTLHTSTYTPNKDTHDYQDDLTNELGTGGGYTAGGFTLANKTVTYDSATDTVVFDADDQVYSSSTLTWRICVFADASPGTAATNPLIAYMVSDADIISSGGDTTIQMPATGIVRMTAS